MGVGGRVSCFLDALVGDFADRAVLVSICDLSQTRMNWHNQRLARKFGAAPVTAYLAKDYDTMIHHAKPDTVIISATDVHHAYYIVRSMEHGCNVICEKPMTIGTVQMNAVLKAIEKTGNRCALHSICGFSHRRPR